MSYEPEAIVLRGSDGARRLPIESLTESEGPAGSTRYDWHLPDSGGVGELHSIGLAISGGARRGDRYFRNGYQSWGFAGIDSANGPVARTALDVICDTQHAIGRPPEDLEVIGESSQFFAADGLVAGVPGCKRANAVTYLTEGGFEVVLDLKRGSFASGDQLESVYLWDCDPGNEASAVDAFLEESARLGGARADSAHMAGWCSWYHYFHDVSEAAVDANLAEASGRFSGLFDLFQLDDGYQRAIGDWLEPNEKFPGGIGNVAEKISAAGMIPGIWFAPFVLFTDSHVYEAHPDWLATDDTGEPMPCIINPEWGGTGFGYALDTTHPEVLAWLEEVSAAFVAMGYQYLKLDFTYAASMDANRIEPATKAEAFQRGIEAIRRGAGGSTTLLGCGMPLWPAIGTVDAMRIGQDVAPYWDPEFEIVGLTETMPATSNALRNTRARARMHRRLWVNDPDCVMLRRTETRLTEPQIRQWADLVADSGQLLLASDDLSLLDRSDLDYWRELRDRSARADVAPPDSPWAPDDFLAG